jgi:hypothetical protein
MLLDVQHFDRRCALGLGALIRPLLFQRLASFLAHRLSGRFVSHTDPLIVGAWVVPCLDRTPNRRAWPRIFPTSAGTREERAIRFVSQQSRRQHNMPNAVGSSIEQNQKLRRSTSLGRRSLFQDPPSRPDAEWARTKSARSASIATGVGDGPHVEVLGGSRHRRSRRYRRQDQCLIVR